MDLITGIKRDTKGKIKLRNLCIKGVEAKQQREVCECELKETERKRDH